MEIIAFHASSLCVCTLTLWVFIVQNVALPNFGVEINQQSNGAIISSLDTLYGYGVWRRRAQNVSKQTKRQTYWLYDDRGPPGSGHKNLFHQVRQNVPQISYISFLDIWMLICMLFVFSTILEFIIATLFLRWGMKTYGRKVSTSWAELGHTRNLLFPLKQRFFLVGRTNYFWNLKKEASRTRNDGPSLRPTAGVKTRSKLQYFICIWIDSA